MEGKILPDWYLKYAQGKSTFDEALLLKIDMQAAQSPKKTIETELEEKRTKPKRAKELIDNLTVKEVASHLRCDPSTVYDLIRSGRLKCQPLGRRRLVPLSSLEELKEAEKKKYYAGVK